MRSQHFLTVSDISLTSYRFDNASVITSEFHAQFSGGNSALITDHFSFNRLLFFCIIIFGFQPDLFFLSAGKPLSQRLMIS